MQMRQAIQNVPSVNSVVARTTWVGAESGSRRVGHGNTAWEARPGLLQPQDGAFDHGEQRASVTDISTRLQVTGIGAAAMGEPEDARLTGGTRSLVRRLLGLNIMAKARPAAIAAKAVKAAKRVIAA
jgi:hypothetical protein